MSTVVSHFTSSIMTEEKICDEALNVSLTLKEKGGIFTAVFKFSRGLIASARDTIHTDVYDMIMGAEEIWCVAACASSYP